MEGKNARILALLDTTQEYLRAMSSLQSSLVDGYLEIAQTKKSSFGIPYTSIPVDENARKIFLQDKNIAPQERELPLVPGVSPYNVEKVQKCFEKALEDVLNATVLLGRVNECIDIVNEDITESNNLSNQE